LCCHRGYAPHQPPHSCPTRRSSALVRLIGHGTKSGIAADFDNPGGPQMLWQKALDALDGRIDVLINNAGIFESNPIDLDHQDWRSEEHTSELQSRENLVCRLLLENK